MLSSAQPAAAAGLGFPRLAHWWGSSSAAENALRDYYVPNDVDPLNPDTRAIANLRALNPDIILLASSSAAELDYSPTNDRAFDSQRIGSIPSSWLLTQIGSTLTSPVSASAVTIPVADTSKFRVNDLVVVDDEKCVVTGVSETLTVKRGYAGSAAATHASGTRIAAVVAGWSNAATLDMTAGCPQGRATGLFATSGTGTEQASDWLARRTAGITAAADWDGVLIDVCVGGYANGYVGSTYCRTIASRTAPTSEADYTAFDQAWQAGVVKYLTQVRALVGTKIVTTNEAPPAFTQVNGSTFEGFPTSTTSSSKWNETIVGPMRYPWDASYLEWSATSATPNLTTIMTFGSETDYRLMRFGLSTALMGDGYYAYEGATSGHSVAGRWYDEYDNAGAEKGYLGSPMGAMKSLVPALSTPDLIVGYGGFADQATVNAWDLYSRTNYAATKVLDGGTARIQVTKSAGAVNGVLLSRPNVSIAAGTAYTLSFRARADRALTIQTLVQQTSSPYANYLETNEVPLTTEWRTFELPLTSSGAGSAADLIFTLGKSVGTIWLDDVKLQVGNRSVYRRDYEGGIALVNATDAAVTVNLDGSFRKIKGTQAPSVNDGSLVTAVTLPAKDGLVLVRTAPTPAPAPLANGDSYTVGNATALTVPAPGLLDNDTAAEGKTLNASALTQPTNGTLTLSANGSFAYTPAVGFDGTDSFTYRAFDGTNYSPTATVSITVTAPGVVVPVEPPATPDVTAPVVPPVNAGPMPVPATPTVVNRPSVKRKSSKSRSYTLSGSVRLGSAATVKSTGYSGIARATTPAVLEVQIERYVKKHWRVYKKVRVVNPSSSYKVRAQLRSGKYRARAVVSGGGVPSARSITTKSFKVR